jgi:hypothetical protein
MSGFYRTNPSNPGDADAPLDAQSRAIDGLLRELAYGPANNVDDERFVDSVMNSIQEAPAHAETRFHRMPVPQRRQSPAHLPAAKKHAAARWDLQWAIWVPVAACFMIAIGAIFFSGPGDNVKVARVFDFSPGVTLARNETSVTVQKNTEIFPNDILQVPADGWAVVKYFDNSRLEIQPNSTLIFGKPDSGVSKKVTVRSGGFNAHVAKQSGGRNLVIDTPIPRRAFSGRV